MHRTHGHPSGQDPGGAHPVDILAVASTHPPAKQTQIPPTSGATGAATQGSPAPQPPETDQDQGCSRPSRLVRVRRNSPGRYPAPDLNPSISIISSFPPPKIPRGPKVPLSFLGGERLQVQTSEINVTELDTRGCVSKQEFSTTNSPSDISRLWVFLRLPKLGTHFSRKKLDALLRGDQSGTVLNRWFVCGPHALGMPFLPGFNETPGIVRFYARRTQTGWECLAELFKESDYKTKAQASVLVAAGHILIRMPQTALLYVQKSCEFIKAGNLRFIPTYGRPPEFSEDLHEILATLSQTVYWANYVFLMCSGPEPHATAELEKEFRQELPVGSLTSTLSHIQLISAIASLSDPLQDLSSYNANARYLTCQRRDSGPRIPPCRR